MTRKDYVLIADALRNARDNSSVMEYRAALTDVATALASQLANDNPRFDRARFLAACGVAGNYTEN